MANIVVNDPSIGEALGVLAKGLGAMNDPKQRAQAAYLQQRINAQELANAEAMRQREAQTGLIAEFDKMLTADRLGAGMPATIEQPGQRPADPNWQGPVQSIPNPAMSGLNDRAAMARAIARNAIMRGGTPEQALQAGYGALGMGSVFAGGVPTDEATGRRVQTMLTGKLPGADERFTPQGGDEIALRGSNLKIREELAKGATLGQNQTLLASPQQQQAWNVGPRVQGQISIGGKDTVLTPDGRTLYGAEVPQGGAAAGPAFSGTGFDQQSASVLDTIRTLQAQGQPVPEALLRRGAIAWNQLYGPKQEARLGPGGAMEAVTIQPNVPPGFEGWRFGIGQAPGAPPPQSTPGVPSGGPAPAVAPGAPVPPQGNVPGNQGAPQAAPPAPGQPVTQNGVTVQTIRPGKPEFPTEAVVKKSQFLQVMDAANKSINQMLAEGRGPSVMGRVLSSGVQSQGEGMLAEAGRQAAGVAQGYLTPNDQTWDTATSTFLNAVLRDESGAAVPESEYPRYRVALIPGPSDTPETLQLKAQMRDVAVNARRTGLSLEETLRALSNISRTNLMPTQVQQLAPIQNDIAPGVPAPQGAPPAAAPAPGGRRFRLGPDGNIVEQ